MMLKSLENCQSFVSVNQHGGRWKSVELSSCFPFNTYHLIPCMTARIWLDKPVSWVGGVGEGVTCVWERRYDERELHGSVWRLLCIVFHKRTGLDFVAKSCGFTWSYRFSFIRWLIRSINSFQNWSYKKKRTNLVFYLSQKQGNFKWSLLMRCELVGWTEVRFHFHEGLGPLMSLSKICQNKKK